MFVALNGNETRKIYTELGYWHHIRYREKAKGCPSQIPLFKYLSRLLLFITVINNFSRLFIPVILSHFLAIPTRYARRVAGKKCQILQFLHVCVVPLTCAVNVKEKNKGHLAPYFLSLASRLACFSACARFHFLVDCSRPTTVSWLASFRTGTSRFFLRLRIPTWNLVPLPKYSVSESSWRSILCANLIIFLVIVVIAFWLFIRA